MKKSGLRRWMIPGLAALLLATSPVAAQRAEPEIHGTFDGEPMYTVLPPGAIPAINSPEFVSGAAAVEQMLPQEPVLGVVIGDEARAYSAWQLDAHEIVNDTVGDSAIAVTW